MWIHRRVVTVLQMLKFPKQKGEREEGERVGERKEWKKGKRESQVEGRARAKGLRQECTGFVQRMAKRGGRESENGGR